MKASELFPPTSMGYEHAPMMHVQERQDSGVTGGASIVGETDRVLTDVVSNSIVGAALSSGNILLDAGVYYISAKATIYAGSTTPSRNIIKVNVVTEAIGSSGRASHDSPLPVSAELNLASPSSITITSVATAGVSDGLGYPTGVAPYEVYGDVKIWQLDAIKTSPILTDNKLYPVAGQGYVTGNMYGLEYSYTTANTITVTGGTCMDSLNNTELGSFASQVVTIPTAINTIYNLFLCDDGIVRTDTDVDGATLLAGTVNQLRWIGFVLTDASGDIIEFDKSGDSYSFKNPVGDMVVASTLTTSYVLYDLSSFAPLSRLGTVTVGGKPNSGLDVVQISVDGVNGRAGITANYDVTSALDACEIPASSDVYYSMLSSAGVGTLNAVKLRR